MFYHLYDYSISNMLSSMMLLYTCWLYTYNSWNEKLFFVLILHQLGFVGTRD